ncbi:MAG: GNAT family N-acetyltransferase [Rhodothermales bacterium]|nr:GNAT family N-acetyltransferase [Rhodothermales bacterium]
MTEQDFEIRTAHRSDVNDICRMWCLLLDEIGSVHSHFARSSDARNRIMADLPALMRDSGCYICVATQNESVIGFGRAQLWRLPPTHQGRDEVYVNEIYVVNDRRGQGVGTEMVQRITDWGQDNGVEALRAAVVASQSGSTKFWRRVGGIVDVQEFVISVEGEAGSVKKRAPLGFGGTTDDKSG